jgi:hypothetical protein
LPTLTTASIRKGRLAVIKTKKLIDVAGTPKNEAKKAQSKSTAALNCLKSRKKNLLLNQMNQSSHLSHVQKRY